MGRKAGMDSRLRGNDNLELVFRTSSGTQSSAGSTTMASGSQLRCTASPGARPRAAAFATFCAATAMVRPATVTA